jgi:hypothetical protein
MILGPPATANRDGGGLAKRQHVGDNAGGRVRPVAKRQIFAPRTAAIGYFFAHLLDDGRLDQVFIK